MPLSAYVQSIIFLIIAAIALFASAGTLAIPGFWIYLGILTLTTAAALIVLSPDLIRERMRPGGQAPPLKLRLVGIIPLGLLVIADVDRGRLHVSDSVPIWLQAVGLAAVAAGFSLLLWAMAVNPFFSSVARIQTDRGQQVITAGPYRYVRHPGYSGALLLIVFSGVALGSWIAAGLLIAIGVLLLLCRLIGEDRLVQAELPGYRDYAQRVRWRLIPGTW